jgi:hypothetical protein
MAAEAVIGQDAAQIGVVRSNRMPNMSKASRSYQFAGVNSSVTESAPCASSTCAFHHANALVLPHRQKVIDHVEPRFALGPVHAGDVDQRREAAQGVVTSETR